MIYITGDTHRDFTRLHNLKGTEEDMLIVLGDAGINYYLNEEDTKYKEYLNSFIIKLFCVRGNHEERPENINTYKEVDMFGGKVYIEENYPNLIFAKDGRAYCPKCNSRDIIIYNKCKKVYGFNDVKYMPNCSKEM